MLYRSPSRGSPGNPFFSAATYEIRYPLFLRPFHGVPYGLSSSPGVRGLHHTYMCPTSGTSPQIPPPRRRERPSPTLMSCLDIDRPSSKCSSYEVFGTTFLRIYATSPSISIVPASHGRQSVRYRRRSLRNPRRFLHAHNNIDFSLCSFTPLRVFHTARQRLITAFGRTDQSSSSSNKSMPSWTYTVPGHRPIYHFTSVIYPSPLRWYPRKTETYVSLPLTNTLTAISSTASSVYPALTRPSSGPREKSASSRCSTSCLRFTRSPSTKDPANIIPSAVWTRACQCDVSSGSSGRRAAAAEAKRCPD